ncbi:protein kinase [Pseudomonas taiwanensis]|uniref:trifunctional serine/threonine-protein kinase/ATP-binding protein/sensor histidine kinase n=1 Tax=Pseudomonas taiwanensis TaxID=470150 RepID=UPI0015C02977|nr:trifunctional serine/threonine-protein kinase/ATP-binding protein/sensor histidine kinase [Pseudomonas taiwanensis]NWL76417.1 protein kinase [Pseudomonas taiwanensis]
MGKSSSILWDDGERTYCRELRAGEEGGQSVLIARLVTEHPSPAALDRLTHEFSLKDDLDGAWAVRPLELVREAGRPCLVYEDPGGELLSELLAAPMETGDFLHLAVGIAGALSRFHQRGLIHKDLKPAHILVNCSDGQARLSGFGLASRLPRERQAPEAPETIAGTLAYMAPEQTGRMNRSIDSRSDLYALGVTLYQMLTGTLPFQAGDAMEWVHCHIARKAIPPHERVATVPAMVSRIVMKLLAKTAEDRYQTAASLEHDLHQCLADWQRQRRIDEFPLDERGTPDQLLIPEKLYGREHEVDALVAAFHRIVNSSSPELVLVSGYSGIGKSSVVNELHKVLVAQHGLFASGKFDQYQRDIPYSTLVQAFQSLLRPLLGKRDSELARWRTALSDALEPNARLMTDLLPELKLIIGEPPPVPELDAPQAKRRFLLVFQRFIGVFAQAEHPLALFLDDLQWLDTATLDLLEELLTSSDLRHLMLIGAYRDNEVDALHPLTGKLQAIRNAGGRIEQISLSPLSAEHITQLLAESLHCGQERIEPLARLMHDKTAGNPFFVIQFLHALVDGGLLAFDHEVEQWVWDARRIHAKGYTENVVDLMVEKLSRLPAETQQALQQLACLGNVAKTRTLASVLGIKRSQVQALLWEAIRQEVVERVEGAYAFVHDRIHEAAYSLIAETSRAEAHLRIGRMLVKQTPKESWEEAIFEIAGQLNRGAGLITDREEREQLAEINLLAGRRAKAATTFASALTYLAAGANLLDEASWERRHELAFALELNRAECEFLTGQLMIADERLAALTNRVAGPVEWARVACVRMDVCLLLNQSDRAVSVCLDFLRHVGIEWSPTPADEVVRGEYERIWTGLAGRPIEGLIDLPLMEDPIALATVEALVKLTSPALHANSNLASLTICKAITLSIEHGNCDASCVAYATVPRITGRRFGDYEAGYRFGELACKLVERLGLQRYEARTYFCFSVFVARWAQPIRSCSDQLQRVFATANRIGDLPFGAFSRNCLVSNLLFAGERLPELQVEAERGLAYARKIRFGLVIGFIENQLALIRTLRGLTPTFGCLDDEHFNEAQAEERIANVSRLLACWHWVRKLQARYLAGDIEAAMEAASQAEEVLWASHSFIEEAEYFFYAALARAALCDSIPAGDREQHLDALVAHQQQLQSWVALCAENFASRALLVSAEIARIEGRRVDAELLYEQAIQSAQESGFDQIEALANELASRFYASAGFHKIARLYLQDARYAYVRWGATGKVRQLEQAHPFLKADDPAPGPTSTIATPVEHLDLATVIKVSQAASSEIVLERLIDMVMRTAIEQAGAERGLLVLSDAGEARIAAEATMGGEAAELQLRDSPVSADMLPESILFHVLRAHESIVLDDASAEPGFAADTYIRTRHCRSILCLPLMNQAKLIGALYLENNLTARVFSPTRIAVLKLVASQAAISLENARLYREVAEREAKIRRLVDANIIGIVVWNASGGLIDANDAFLRIIGYAREDLSAGRLRWRDLTPPEFMAISERSLASALQTGRAQPYEKEYIRKDGSRVPVVVGLASFEGSRKEGVAFVLDLTERKQAEEKVRGSERRYREVQTELAHANRVATMGQLTATIAHEVNQPIAATILNAQVAQRLLGASSPDLGEVGNTIGRIIRDGNRAADVIGRIRELLRKAPSQKLPMDINEAILEMVEFTRGQASKGKALVKLQLAEGLPRIEGDRVELQQVLLNLIINALEAMSDIGDGGRQLVISTVEDGGGYVRVAVSDSGPGFASEPEQIFAPFYTTKSAGLGMGLSICRSIIDAHGGQLWASGNDPRGATVQFTVPVHNAAS